MVIFTTYGQFSTDISTQDYLIFLSNKMAFRNSSFPLECSKAKKCKIQTKIESWISHLSPNRNWLYYSPLVTTSGKLISRTVVGGQKNRPDKPQPPNTYSIAIARRNRTLELLQGQILTWLEQEFWLLLFSLVNWNESKIVKILKYGISLNCLIGNCGENWKYYYWNI